MPRSDDQYKEKFRPADKLDQEVEQALEGVSLESLYGFDKPQDKPTAEQSAQGVRRGRIVSVDEKKGEVFVDFGGKSQGLAQLMQFDEIPTVGTEMEFQVEKYDPSEGLLILNKKGAAASNVNWDNLEVGQIVEGVVTGVNKGGLELEVKGMRAFMPSGQVDLYFQPDLSTHIGQKMTAEVTQFSREAKNLILSRRNLLEREKEDAKQKMLAEVAEGQIRRGTVRSMMEYGAFVDLGGMDGLLHISEITHRRGRKPEEFLKIGDVVDVKIIKFDRESGKLSLSLKQTMADPWTGAEGRYSVGTQVTGRVTKIESFGAFVEVEEGLEGLLPISEISWQRIKHPSDVVREGDTLRLVVLGVDPTAKRMSFSLKQAGPDPWANVTDRYATDMVTSGTVTRLADFGAFVELEPGLEGLVHISELSNQRVRTPGDVVKQGESVKVRVLEIDKEARRISLSIRRAADVESTPAAASAPTGAQPKRKRPQLRGGLEF